MAIILNRNTEIEGALTPAVHRAAAALRRDISKVFKESGLVGAVIRLVKTGKEVEAEAESEQFTLKVVDDCLEVRACDERGFIYGIYEVSRSILGVMDFWFWNDQKFVPVEKVELAEDYCFHSKPCAVKYRGWFINDEVLLHVWKVERKEDLPWEMAFETLLRLKGNMVIPGTDRNSEKYRKLASAMGLMITHHHAEPLGAEMFARAYPDLNPSYAEYPEKFQVLWKEALKAQEGMEVIWNLGFRGQGDCPFWENDKQYETDEARGELLSSLIRIQYDLVKEADRRAVCCTNLYGEIMELYQKGCLDLPADVIKIWADNGYGKMVSRRQDNHNPRISALPELENKEHNGIYYHVSFYDLQAANHVTMLPNSPYFVAEELEEVLKRNGGDFWIINCSNIKPHVYFLDLIASMWRDGSVDMDSRHDVSADSRREAYVDAHRKAYVECYYGKENSKSVENCLAQYPNYAVQYGEHADEHAGEQFVNHVPRMFISQMMKDMSRRCDGMLWATGAKSLKEQVEWYAALCVKGAGGYEKYLKECEHSRGEMRGEGKILFEDSLLLQVRLLYHCYQGAFLVSKSILAALEEEYQQAFYLAGKARREYLAADNAMRSREHGKWHDFYANECLTDIKQTAWVLEGFMSFVRNLGDGPHFYKWQREFLYPEEDRRVLLLLNVDNHLKDWELFELMEEKWDS
ncbi:MAG: glycosyl hydrolase 115 family protein [Clostridiales bacterium]|nr:glycosyl hydrolase 115 family protein [Clostridiales bacterium]